MNLIQLQHEKFGRRVGIIKEPDIVLLDSVTTTYELFLDLINDGRDVGLAIDSLLTNERLPYDAVYHSHNKWHILPPIDTNDPMHCMLSGTGLTHRASAENRQKMHESQKQDQLTDSMQMYLWGEEGGKPSPGKIGIQPEWFYKGNGFNLKGHGEPLVVPGYGDDGGEEPEIAGIYLINNEGEIHRLGFTQANEFSDHVMEKKNYLYLAPSKIRNCSIGPELILTEGFKSLKGTVRVIRNGKTFWEQEIHSGEEAMAHSLANLEYHHFKYSQHRIPGQLHIHFFGAGAFSFGDNIRLEQRDEMFVSFQNMGRPLVNPLHIDSKKETIPRIKTIY